MNASLVLKEMRDRGLIQWDEDNYSVLIDGDGTDWSQVKVWSGKTPVDLPSEEVAEQVWNEIKAPIQRESLNVELLNAFREGSKSSKKALDIFMPMAQAIELMTKNIHIVLQSPENVGKTAPEIVYEAIVSENLTTVPPKYSMESLPDLSNIGEQNWAQSWENFKSFTIPNIDLEAPGNQDYADYIMCVNLFLANWGIKVSLTR